MPSRPFGMPFGFGTVTTLAWRGWLCLHSLLRGNVFQCLSNTQYSGRHYFGEAGEDFGRLGHMSGTCLTQTLEKEERKRILLIVARTVLVILNTGPTPTLH